MAAPQRYSHPVEVSGHLEGALINTNVRPQSFWQEKGLNEERGSYTLSREVQEMRNLMSATPRNESTVFHVQKNLRFLKLQRQFKYPEMSSTWTIGGFLAVREKLASLKDL